MDDCIRPRQHALCRKRPLPIGLALGRPQDRPVSFLLDTNVVSEWVRPRPDAGVVTLAELRRGIERLAPGRRRNLLDDWLRDELPMRFEGRILPIDVAIAETWGQLVARSETAGRAIHAMDAFIAATASAHGLTLVTRDVGGFKGTIPSVFNPWSDV